MIRRLSEVVLEKTDVRILYLGKYLSVLGKYLSVKQNKVLIFVKSGGFSSDF